MVVRPNADEYNPYYGGYIGLVPEAADVLAVMSAQPDELHTLLQSVTDDAASVRPAPAEWSVKEVLGHIVDTERVFAYRTLRIARGDTTPIPGYEQDDYIANTNFNARTVTDLVDEFTFQRRANLLLVKSLTADELARRGTASENPVSARALVYILAGHVIHHVVSLRTDYKVGG